MALATDNQDMLKDPISKSYYIYFNCYHSNTQICVELEWPRWLPQRHTVKQVTMVTYKQQVYTITVVTGIQATDAQVVEVHDCFSTNELLTYEALVSSLCIWVNFQ